MAAKESAAAAVMASVRMSFFILLWIVRFSGLFASPLIEDYEESYTTRMLSEYFGKQGKWLKFG